VTIGGDASATVQSTIVKTGSYAAQLGESANAGSKAYARRAFSSAQPDLTASGDFRILQQGASGSNVPFFRFFTSSGTRLVNVYRQNGTSGAIWVSYGGAYYSTTGTLALNTWASVSVHLVVNGAASSVTVTLNGQQIYQTTTANLGAAGIATLQLGNDTAAQTFSLVADNISVQGASSAKTVALWHMDETSGTVMRDSVGTHNGVLHSVQLGLPGFSGTAFGFNGSSSYVDVPSTADLNPGSADITFTIHLQTTGTPPPAPADWDLFRKGLYTSGGAEYKMEFQRTGQASCGFEGTGGYAELAAGPAINDGRWHTVSCVKTSTAIQVVVDGQVFSKSAKVGSIANTTDLIIGSRPGSDWYKGQLDEASIQIG
jgi:Concanavalin A-like lectin/glucanases superfamily